jgi:hypothetical protein
MSKLKWHSLKIFENEKEFDTYISTKIPRSVGYTRGGRKTCAICKFELKSHHHTSQVQNRDCTAERCHASGESCPVKYRVRFCATSGAVTLEQCGQHIYEAEPEGMLHSNK